MVGTIPMLPPGACLWLTHRLHRDAFLERSYAAGVKGWLQPPIHFFSELPVLFDIKAKPIGQLARRERISRIADAVAPRFGMPTGRGSAVIRGHMLDTFFGELLPEGVTPTALEHAVGTLEPDEFGQRRNSWLVASYTDYLAGLYHDGVYDPRQIHGLVADRIDAGQLSSAIHNATALHIYALYSTRSRRRLLASLKSQDAVEVYVHGHANADDVRTLASNFIAIEKSAEPEVVVQPAPDAYSELNWLAGEVKRLLTDGTAEPHEIAVVARTGLEDTRRARHVLECAGIPATARVRTPLSEIAALRAVLDVFRAAADGWSYRALRSVLASPYLGMRMDTRPFDRIAEEARPESLGDWQDELDRLLKLVEDGDPDAKRMGIQADKLQSVVARFTSMRPWFERFGVAKSTAEWIALTQEMLADRGFRLQICRPRYDRFDIVRIDQRGVRQVEALLAEWALIDLPAASLEPRAWYRLVRTLLDGQELVLTTPGQKGVQVLEAHDAALAPFKATFLIHANDGEFPRVASNAGLFTEEERTALRQQLPIDDRDAVLARERALWQAITMGSRVYVSYRTTDPRGTPLLPSLLAPAPTREELPRTRELIGDPLNLDHERRLAAERLAEAIRTRQAPSQIAVVDPLSMRRALVAAHAEQLRGAPDRRTSLKPVNPWNGQLRDPVVLAHIRERFGPDYPWSPTALQSYSNCPFFFLIDRILYFRDLEEADEDASALTVGGIAHDVLEKFYHDVMGALPMTLDAAASARLEAVAEQVFEDREQKREWLGSPMLWRHRRQQILHMLNQYLDWELPFLAKKKEVPVYCEYRLGGETGHVLISGVDAQGNAVQMRVQGRIDRLDQDASNRHSVLDYKTGSIPAPKGYADGVTLQAPVYLEALRKSGMAVAKGRYRSLKNPGKPQNGAEVDVDDGDYRSALAIAFSIPDRIRAGLFEVCLACSSEWRGYDHDLSIRRTSLCVEKGGTRFDG